MCNKIKFILAVCTVYATVAQAHIFTFKNYTNKELPIRIRLEADSTWYEGVIPPIKADKQPGVYAERFVLFEGTDWGRSAKFGFCLQVVQLGVKSPDGQTQWKDAELHPVNKQRQQLILETLLKGVKPDKSIFAGRRPTSFHFCYSCEFFVVEDTEGTLRLCQRS
jgi:hypothetical protein